VTIVRDEERIHTGGPYSLGGQVFQAYSPLPIFGDNHVVVGSWVIDGTARGIGIRESDGPITGDLARFVPHYFLPGPNDSTGKDMGQPGTKRQN
jgi:glutathionylspermidine synthase